MKKKSCLLSGTVFFGNHSATISHKISITHHSSLTNKRTISMPECEQITPEETGHILIS